MSNDAKRPYDIVLWGATGFTGQLVAEHLLARHGVTEDLRWAIAGRNEKKLRSLRDELGSGATNLSIVLGDANDPVSLRAMAEQAKVVCTTVGPYAQYGSELVAACVDTGTDYCDLTGEVQWIRRMIDEHHAAAAEAGTRIVHCCGFDCIPTDLGTWFTQQQMVARHGAPSPHVSIRVTGARAGVSGGTLASMINLFEDAADPATGAVLDDPYALNPADQRHGPDGADPVGPTRDADGHWTAPWLMTVVDAKVVRRTHALLGHPWGKDFRLDERLRLPKGPAGLALATTVATGMAGMYAGGSFKPVRTVLDKLLPDPGTGPSEKTRKRGWFNIRFHAHDTDGDIVLRTRVVGDRDPGYGSTARMIGEAAACLALDDLDSPGGVLTPAAAMGQALVDRLNEHAGVTFTVDE